MHQDGETLLLMLYVDDFFLTGSSDKLISWLKVFLHKEFEMTNLGPIRHYLGISFERVLLGLFLTSGIIPSPFSVTLACRIVNLPLLLSLKDRSWSMICTHPTQIQHTIVSSSVN